MGEDILDSCASMAEPSFNLFAVGQLQYWRLQTTRKYPGYIVSLSLILVNVLFGDLGITFY